MMNIRNLGPKGSAGVNFKEGICTELCLKLQFERDGYFCNIIESECLKVTVQKESSKESLTKLTSEAAVCRCY